MLKRPSEPPEVCVDLRRRAWQELEVVFDDYQYLKPASEEDAHAKQVQNESSHSLILQAKSMIVTLRKL